jgi:hypothetical protein
LRFAFKEIPATFVGKCEWTRRKEDGMTVELEEFTKWRANIETRVSTLEATSDQHVVKISDHGGLLVSMDEDVSKIQVEFRAQRGMLQALHDTQSEHVTVLREHTALLKEHGTLLGQHSRQLAEIQTGVQTIIGLLDRGIDGNKSGDS